MALFLVEALVGEERQVKATAPGSSYTERTDRRQEEQPQRRERSQSVGGPCGRRAATIK